MENNFYKKLTKEEKNVIVNKKTEPPFSGRYNEFSKKGSYHCKRCNALLYQSNDKFTSTCGWPSFDDEVKGAIKREKDVDGIRTEILCTNCKAHLGHVFEGEGYTNKNIRHCVNSISLIFVPKRDTFKKAYFAGGCFWGVEYFLKHKEGIISVTSGYMGGATSNPSYQDVIYNNTGHFESVEVEYDSLKINYEDLAKYFFEIHDPTQRNGQGPDIGDQYKSVVFYNDEEEKNIIQKLLNLLKDKGYEVVTKLLPVSKFWEAEEYHQNYYDKNNSKPYCHAYKKRF
jgi:peptide methionine sulfoxide reductase msrA/msrB